jgi:cytochrome c-type biogenesis protein CcmE
MNPKRKKRLILIGLMVAGVSVAVAMALKAFNENLMFFFSPVEVAQGKAPDNAPFRLGGMVVEGSVQRPGDGILVEFGLTDHADTVTVRYEGILPDLFREGQGIVALGRLDGEGVFVADEVLAKHDENYMPPEVAEALKTAQAHTQNAASAYQETGAYQGN